MFIKVVILTFALTLDGQVHAGKIVGGHEAEPHSRPYMVLLQMRTQAGTIRFCGGLLLNEDFVMTAAHCQARSYTVFLGVHNFKRMNNTQKILVEKEFPHKDYNETGFQNDIMILKMSSKANFSKVVKPIELAGQSYGCLPKSCSISGWGFTDKNNKHLSPVLMEANVALTDDVRCHQENTYCSEGETGTGHGDSGGPLVCEDGKAYGVVSTSFKSDSGGPTIYFYTKIYHYISWIDQTLEPHGMIQNK